MRYPVSVFECWLLVWVLLDTTNSAENSLQCAAPVDMRVIGINTTNFLAGYVEVLCNGAWMPVCAEMWDRNDARITCQTLNFTRWERCSQPCLGLMNNRAMGGVKVIGCTKDTQRFTDNDCILQTMNKQCDRAGVICVTDISTTSHVCECPTPSSMSSCPTRTSCNCSCTKVQISNTSFSCVATSLSTSPSTSQIPLATASPPPERATAVTPTTAGGKGEEQREGPVSCTAIGGGLGALAAGLGVALVGVVVGWVWHCRRHPKRQQENIHEATNPLSMPHPSIQYSSQGPRDTPISTSSTETSFATYDVVGSPAHSEKGPTPLQERVYQVLEGPGEGRKEGEGPDYQEEGEEEGEYHVLGEVEGGIGLGYEVPIPTATLEQAKKQADTHYSSLQHH